MHLDVKKTCWLMIFWLATGWAQAEEGEWAFKTGMEFSSGDYGDTTDTDIVYFPFTGAYKIDNWTYKATVAWLQIDGPGTVVGAGGDGVVVGKRGRVSQSTTTESGFGDIWLGAFYSVEEFPPELFYLDLGGRIKIPTADEDKGLGTGEVDYSFQADLFKPLGEVTPFATLAYKIKGDPPGIDLHNVVALSIGADIKLDPLNNVGVSLDFQEAASPASADALELFGYFNHTLTDKFKAMLYGFKGIKDGSPDFGFGVQLSYKP